MKHLTIWSIIAVAAPCWAEDPKPAPMTPPPERREVTNHTMKLGGEDFNYRATAGTLSLRDDDGKVTASVFYVAYTKSGAEAAKRPITFTFNGGPGSSSVWLHMGAFGPKRVAMTDEGMPLPPPGKLVENDLTILDLTDLVFIDPVTTGFSRAAPGVDPKKFHGVQQDLDAVGEFIRLFTTKNNRWDSPKFLAGESYGTTRASALVGHMQDKHGMNFNGVILVSAILNFQTTRFDDGNDLPPALFLPTFAATAWYHKRVPSEHQNLRKFLDEVEKFAEGEYATALMRGDKLRDGEQQAIARKIAHFTGLSEAYVQRTNLRVEISRFTKELLREQRRTIGRFDSRMTGIDAEVIGERHEYDPSYAAIQGSYTAAFNQYVRDELKFENDAPYEILTGKVQPWDYGDAKNRFLNVAPLLRTALNKNRSLRVFVASGYYDMATPYFATDYTLNHLRLDKEIRGHITTEYYEAGHMMYVHRPSHKKLKKDLTKFYASALGSGGGS